MGVTCAKCGATKPRDEFFKNKSNKTGLHSYCKSCVKEYDKERYPNGKPRARARYLENTYNLTLNDWEALFDSQGRVCAICGIEPDRPVVDHCHTSGEVRGILCDTCNRCLGLLKDDASVLIAGAAYLIQHEAVLTAAGGE